MTPHLPVVSGQTVVALLERLGFVWITQRGSHVKLRRVIGSEVRTVIIPLHDELAPGTLRSILRQAGLSISEFAQWL